MRLESGPVVVATFLFHSYSIRFPLHDPDLSSDHSAPPVVLQASESGLCHGLVVWWSADMEGSELSMDPWNYQQVRHNCKLF